MKYYTSISLQSKVVIVLKRQIPIVICILYLFSTKVKLTSQYIYFPYCVTDEGHFNTVRPPLHLWVNHIQADCTYTLLWVTQIRMKFSKWLQTEEKSCNGGILLLLHWSTNFNRKCVNWIYLGFLCSFQYIMIKYHHPQKCLALVFEISSHHLGIKVGLIYYICSCSKI